MAVARASEAWKDLLAEGRRDGRLVHEGRTGPSQGVHVAIPDDLHPDVLAALKRSGIERLYGHQRAALERAWEQSLIVTTGTASGKSLCFNLPTLEVLCRDPRARALYLYPTKALAQDQARSLAAFGLTRQLRPAIYDGDTPREQRAHIRRTSNVVLTNPDMLHVGILPNHAAWGDFLANLALVVVDEAHVYRGVFGSHVANVLRRLRRLCAAYGTAPRFLLTSATIANPQDLAERLTGLEDFALIDRDDSPAPRRKLAIWNPPLEDERTGARRSSLTESAALLASLVRAGARVICFIKSRKAVELVSRLTAAELARDDPALADRVAAYRAGYTAGQRRELERALVSGDLRAVVTTDALELGIDIGQLDVAVVVGFPGTVASLRQMWGRAGRRGQGLALYMAGEDALDQFFCRYPDELLERTVEAAILDHESAEIHLAHLLCAAHEGPLSAADAGTLGPRWDAYAEMLVAAGELRKRAATYVPRAPGDYPAARVALRSASFEQFTIVDASSGEMLGTTEAARAYSTVHEGAIYLHMGRSYEVRELDLGSRRALVAPFSDDWYTQPKRETETVIERLLDRRTTLGVTLSFGTVSVTDTVLGYQRRSLADHAAIDLRVLDLPPTSFTTQALWYELDSDWLAQELPSEVMLGTLHASEHSQIAVLPLLAMCDRWDIGGLSTNLHPQTAGPTIFIYDGHPGGVGITRQAFQRFEELVADAHRLVNGCPCEAGCPSCVQSPKCGNLNEPLSKSGALVLMGAMLSSRDGLAAAARSA